MASRFKLKTIALVQNLKLIENDLFFFISNFKFNKKAQRGATLIHGKYTRVPLNGRNN
jgi:hypothetical protein